MARLCNLSVIVLVTLVAEGAMESFSLEVRKISDKFVDSLLDRSLKLVTSPCAELEKTISAKPGHVALSSRIQLRPLLQSGTDASSTLMSFHKSMRPTCATACSTLHSSRVVPTVLGARNVPHVVVRQSLGDSVPPSQRSEVQDEQSAELTGQTEAALMGPASAQSLLQPSPPGAVAYNALVGQGVTRLNTVLSAESASAARGAVIKRLEVVAREQKGDDLDKTQLGNVRVRKNRYDLLLQLDGGAVEAAVREALSGSLGELLEEAVGANAIMYELAALVSDVGAPPQPIHPDTPYQPETPLVTAFIALQDVGVEMGPTLFLPGSHRDVVHADFLRSEAAKNELLERTTVLTSALGVGDCSVFDSRLLHAGAENTSGRRVLLYFSFGNPVARLPASALFTSSIAPEAMGRYRLANFLPGTKTT